MIANNSGREARRLRDTYPARVGHIYSPGGFRGPWANYALDNGAFSEWSKGKPFNDAAFVKLIQRAGASEIAPRWVAAPDVVTDREGTLARWHEWLPVLSETGWPLAFVVQDGMTSSDVPDGASVIFVGGSTEWKQSTAADWCRDFARVHIGRVNGDRDLWRYHRLGAESCDGTGWFRGARKQLDALWYYLADSEGLEDSAHGPMQRRLFA